MKKHTSEFRYTERFRKQLRHDIYRVPHFIPVQGLSEFEVKPQKKPLFSSWMVTAQLFVASMLMLSLFSMLLLGPTVSYYQDTESATANTFATGLVDFVLEDTPFSTASSTNGWAVDVLPNEQTNPFYYYASSTDFYGDLDLCDAITVTATLDGEVMYEGPLTELVSGTTTIIDTWTYTFDGLETFPGKTCHFSVDYKGWQTRHGYVEGGYSDIETVEFWLTVPEMLITKAYFDYDSTDCIENETASSSVVIGSTQPLCEDVSQTQEWVELYNLTNEPIDISGWFICDSGLCDMLPTSTPIGAGEYALIAQNGFIHEEISIPLGVVPIILPDGVIGGDGLTTGSDMLQLLNAEGVVVDQLNWGITKPTWHRYDGSQWASGELLAMAGGALARLPIDVDTNQPEDFKVLGIPELTLVEPTGINAFVTAGEVITIEWEANNPNGLDSDLRIDLYYFDEELNLYLVELNVPNTGSYEYIVPADIEGQIRFKIVAIGPENPLLNRRVLSEEVTVEGCYECVEATPLRLASAESEASVTAGEGKKETATTTASTTKEQNVFEVEKDSETDGASTTEDVIESEVEAPTKTTPASTKPVDKQEEYKDDDKEGILQEESKVEEGEVVEDEENELEKPKKEPVKKEDLSEITETGLISDEDLEKSLDLLNEVATKLEG